MGGKRNKKKEEDDNNPMKWKVSEDGTRILMNEDKLEMILTPTEEELADFRERAGIPEEDVPPESVNR